MHNMFSWNSSVPDPVPELNHSQDLYIGRLQTLRLYANTERPDYGDESTVYVQYISKLKIESIDDVVYT